MEWYGRTRATEDFCAQADRRKRATGARIQALMGKQERFGDRKRVGRN